MRIEYDLIASRPAFLEYLLKRRDQVADFVLELCRIVDGPGDFLAKNLSIAATQAMDRYRHCFFRQTQLAAELCVRERRRLAGEKDLQPVKEASAASGCEFLAHPGQGLFEQGHCPTP